MFCLSESCIAEKIITQIIKTSKKYSTKQEEKFHQNLENSHINLEVITSMLRHRGCNLDQLFVCLFVSPRAKVILHLRD